MPVLSVTENTKVIKHFHLCLGEMRESDPPKFAPQMVSGGMGELGLLLITYYYY